MWGATSRPRGVYRPFFGFNPRAPCGARPCEHSHSTPCTSSFNPRAPCGARHVAACLSASSACFNPRAPCGARPFCRKVKSFVIVFQSTRPVRGATCRHDAAVLVDLVSIHAPRAGRDATSPPYRRLARQFQSTRPVRGATRTSSYPRRHHRRFNPRAPCGARLHMDAPVYVRNMFQSTRPVRGATFVVVVLNRDSCVSIHAPRAGRDTPHMIDALRSAGFNPRAPCGARPRSSTNARSPLSFQSTRPVRGATSVLLPLATPAMFQSTRPVRGATGARIFSDGDNRFQSTRPVRGATRAVSPIWTLRRCFNPRAPCGARLS